VYKQKISNMRRCLPCLLLYPLLLFSLSCGVYISFSGLASLRVSCRSVVLCLMLLCIAFFAYLTALEILTRVSPCSCISISFLIYVFGLSVPQPVSQFCSCQCAKSEYCMPSMISLNLLTLLAVILDNFRPRLNPQDQG
jgi:hypothetical protein